MKSVLVSASGALQGWWPGHNLTDKTPVQCDNVVAVFSQNPDVGNVKNVAK
jgi:hypothetical protein